MVNFVLLLIFDCFMKNAHGWSREFIETYFHLAFYLLIDSSDEDPDVYVY